MDQIASDLFDGIAQGSAADLDSLTETVADTYDKIAETYHSRHFEDDVITPPLADFCEMLRDRGLNSVFVIGSATGSEVGFLISRGLSVLGIDASKHMVELARTNVPTAQFMHMGLQDLNVPAARFDAIWCARTLIHIPAELTADLLASWKRVLRPGGLLGLGVILGEGEHWAPEEYDTTRPMFTRYFKSDELSELLPSVGFDHIRTIHIEDANSSHHTTNEFVFAIRTHTSVDDCRLRESLTAHTATTAKIHPADIEGAIALLLRAGELQPIHYLQLCVLYDQLAFRERQNNYLHKVTAQKLKLHLQSPSTLESESPRLWFDFGRLHLKLTQFYYAVQCFQAALRGEPDHVETLIRLAYCYEGLEQFDKAIETAEKANDLSKSLEMRPTVLAELYHALGHFFIDRSHLGKGEPRVSDMDTGDQYMQRACDIDPAYLSCLGGIYTETERCAQAVEVFEAALARPEIQGNVALFNEMHFYRGEALLCMGRYDDALSDFQHVGDYATSTSDGDALAHSELYKVRANLQRADVGSLDAMVLRDYLQTVLRFEPSLYVVHSFRADRRRLINILRAFIALRSCLDQRAGVDCESALVAASTLLERVAHDRDTSLPDCVVLVDNVGAHLAEVYRRPDWSWRVFTLGEVLKELDETLLQNVHVWALILQGKSSANHVATAGYLLGLLEQAGATVYVWDPNHWFGEDLRSHKGGAFVTDLADVFSFTHMTVLYEYARAYLRRPKTPLGMAPIGVAPSLLAAQAEYVEIPLA